MAPIWEPPARHTDPMAEKERVAMRRKVADSLHALARKIENETVHVESIAVHRDPEPDHSTRPGEHRVVTPIRETMTLTYHIPTRTT